MSFIQTPEYAGKGFGAGYFLVDDENCTRVTAQIAQNHAAVVTRADGTKYVPAGSIIPANGSTAVGILYEDVDVTVGNMPGSIVTTGAVYKDRLPVAPESDAVTALTGIVWDDYEPTITRPSFNDGTLSAITVASVAGSGAGKTDVSVSGYSPKAGEKYAYKVAGTAPAAWYGMVLDNTWTVATFPLDELTATTGDYITVVSVDAYGSVVAAGNKVITSKA